MTRPIRALVVDDSALVRQILSSILTRQGRMSVATAADPVIAIQKISRERPDVIVLDLEMPRMSGLAFLRQMDPADPIPVVVCSSFAASGEQAALRALEEGAVGVVEKPRLGVKDFLEDSATMLVETIRGASQAKARRRPRRPLPRRDADAVLPARKVVPGRVSAGSLIAIGASTGGTEALRQILEALPATTPGIVIVQHMPEGFTRAFAHRLDTTCALEVKEAADGDAVLPGRALIAPGNHHLRVRRRNGGFFVQVSGGPLVSRHRPSVDVLFRSVAQAAGADAVGVILTGMGDDGAAGLREMRETGAVTLAQSEATCVVFGMPRAAVAGGAVTEVVHLQRMPARILERASGLAAR